jgi:hypothetical protein
MIDIANVRFDAAHEVVAPIKHYYAYDGEHLKNIIKAEIVSRWSAGVKRLHGKGVSAVNRELLRMIMNPANEAAMGDIIMDYQRGRINVRPKFYAEGISSFLVEFRQLLRVFSKSLYDVFRDKPWKGEGTLEEYVDTLLDSTLTPIITKRNNIFEYIDNVVGRMKDYT